MGRGGGDGRSVSGSEPWIDRMLALFGSGRKEETWRDRSPGEAISESDWYLVETLPFRRIEVPGHRAMGEWVRLRQQDLGYPVIVGPEEHVIRLTEQWVRQERDPAGILAAAERLQMPHCLSSLRGAWGVERDPPIGDWPEDEELQPQLEPSILRDALTGSLIEKAHILLIPCEYGHEVPAYLNFGAWNWCPPPEHHVAALRDWNRLYGAELVSLGGDIVELKTAKRPVLSTECLALAREQFDYCSDVLDQGHETLSGLAAVLKEADWWHFWWD